MVGGRSGGVRQPRGRRQLTRSKSVSRSQWGSECNYDTKEEGDDGSAISSDEEVDKQSSTLTEHPPAKPAAKSAPAPPAEGTPGDADMSSPGRRFHNLSGDGEAEQHPPGASHPEPSHSKSTRTQPKQKKIRFGSSGGRAEGGVGVLCFDGVVGGSFGIGHDCFEWARFAVTLVIGREASR